MLSSLSECFQLFAAMTSKVLRMTEMMSERRTGNIYKFCFMSRSHCTCIKATFEAYYFFPLVHFFFLFGPLIVLFYYFIRYGALFMNYHTLFLYVLLLMDIILCREEYLKLRKQCLEVSVFKIKEEMESDISQIENAPNSVSTEGEESIITEDIPMTTASLSSKQAHLDPATPELPIDTDAAHNNTSDKEMFDEKPTLDLPDTEEDRSDLTHADSSDCESSNDKAPKNVESQLNNTAAKEQAARPCKTNEDFATWQRIIRLDALRANAEWVPFSPTQAAVSKERAVQLADTVGLQDYDHLEPYRIYHASRLVAILEAYAMHDPEIGYCQGMSDLLAPIISVIEADYEAFWCFVGFMKKARHNFRLDEVGIRRQLNLVSKIIKCKDQRLFSHLEKLEAEDCFFVYRMVVVMFRRELTFEQTVSLWEVMWADQTARRAGIGGSAWGPIRLDAPPTDDLLLYAIAASVLQKRKVIIESYSGMDEIIRECNSMAGQLDVWKLLDDAHDLVVTLHDRIE